MSLNDDGATSDSDCPDRSEGVVNSNETPVAAHKYITYHRRWYLLASLTLLSLSNGMVCVNLCACVVCNLVRIASKVRITRRQNRLL